MGLAAIQNNVANAPVYPGAPDLSFWVSADDSQKTFNGSDLSQFDDLSSNGKNLTPGTAAAQPAFTSGSANGKPSLTFAGTEYMINAALSLTQPYTVFIAAKSTVTAAYMMDSNSATRGAAGFNLTGGGKFDAFAGASLSSTFRDDGKTHLYGALFNGASSQLYVDGIADGAGNAGADALTGINLGISVGAVQGMVGTISELALYDRELSFSERKTIEAYLTHKWGIIK